MYNNWTRLDVREECQIRLRDTAATIYGTARLDRYVRDGYREWCIATGACWHREALPLTTSQAAYNLPDRLHKVDRVVYNYYRLDPLIGSAFKNEDRVFETEEGEPLGYLMDGESGDETLGSSSAYQKRIRFVRVPNQSFSNVYLEWLSIGDDLADDSDVLWNMADHHIPAVIYYVLWKAFAFEGPGQHLGFAAHFKQRFDEMVQRTINRKARARSNRVMRMGEGAPHRGGVRLARMPWNYGKVVR